MWEQNFILGIKESNPHCVFKFKHHRVSEAKKRNLKSNAPLVYAEASCKFKACSVTLQLKMVSRYRVDIFYQGSVNHNISEQHHRQITGNAREKNKQFMSGIKPLPQFLKEYNKLTPEQLISGNRDGMGENSRVFAQIASEALQLGRYDSDLVKSLLLQLSEMQKTIDGGFTQKLCACPLYVLYWSNHSLVIFNDRAKYDTLFWDATVASFGKGIMVNNF